MNDIASLPLKGIFYNGTWQSSPDARSVAVISPATGEKIAEILHAGPQSVDAAVAAAKTAFRGWSRTPLLERGQYLKRIAQALRDHADELALIEAEDGGNPLRLVRQDVFSAAAQVDYFAGLVTEIKGHSIPRDPGSLNYTIREPWGVVARIIPFNHPILFCASKSAAPLAAGNTVVVKPPEQAPLSALRFAEIIADILPPGVLNIVAGGSEAGARLTSHPDIARIALTGSVQTGRAVLRAAAERIRPVQLELGGKNALIAFDDADPAAVASAMVGGMNFTWAGQSCGSTSRAFIHETIYEDVLEHLKRKVADVRPGLPTKPETVMGSLIDRRQYDRVMNYIEIAHREGARLIAGGKHPDDPLLKDGCFIEPTIFADVDLSMTIAREEIFGPILSVFRWNDEQQLVSDVNSVEYGLTCSIWTNDLHRAHRMISAVEAGFVWVNETTRHFIGAPFGGYKQSGLGREESIDELLDYTQIKHVHIKFHPAPQSEMPAA
ncbi:Betaine-aldehyde dehydrogenase [Rhizobium sp. CF080]|uniref:aldehyde dehydrogenase family protein n=1 Tax=Rhizobium sp. (strain CF080) TaxID=1144310 RepID=UPI000271BDCD|nr:aldehyde dehydrogenase family protein [Rhizobium sp. CF080]EUB99157.1 Betaine-aldehyde dehydrogenase [Rhizobium sp. CF080]